MRITHGLARVHTGWAFMLLCGFTATASAQWNNYQNYSIQRLGLFGAANTGGSGIQESFIFSFGAPGFVSGFSTRYIGVNTSNGRDAWIWNGTATQQVGLVGGVHTAAGGLQFAGMSAMDDAGKVAGISTRYTGASVDNGRDAWVWNGTTTQQVGFIGGTYTGSGGYQFSLPSFVNAAGQTTGYSQRITGVNTINGQDAWVWNGTTHQQIGLTGGAHTGSAGLQFSNPEFQNAAGQIMGISNRYLGVNTDNGHDAWVWNGTSTQQIGFTGGANTGSAGFQISDVLSQGPAGHLLGYSERYTGVSTYNGRDAWVWNAGTIQQLGFTGAGYTGSGGYQYSAPSLANASGQVTGISSRIAGVNTDRGRDAWVWNAGVTQQIGLVGGAHTGSTGYQYSATGLQNAAGEVTGISLRFTGVNADNGRDSWVWNGSSTLQTGLVGGAYTGSGGYQFSQHQQQNVLGDVAGYSQRITGVNTVNGQDAWVWDGVITRQVGLSGGIYTGSGGFQFSQPYFLNDAGFAAGSARRIGGVNTSLGEDTWYYDPATHVVSAVIGSVRTIDNNALSTATLLTDGGFLLGNYYYFAGGVGNGEQRAFIYRPDLGFTDLGNLVNGGLTANGWSLLQSPVYSDALNTIVGYGFVSGQSTGKSVFVMTVPTPGACCLFGFSGLMAIRRFRGASR